MTVKAQTEPNGPPPKWPACVLCGRVIRPDVVCDNERCPFIVAGPRKAGP